MKDQPGLTSFYRRPLPEGLIPFASTEGRRLFREALAAGGMEGWFALSEQFHTQTDPAFCGLGTLVVVLNALEIDPGRVWKGAWRWYGEDLLDCCLPLEKVRQQGVTLDELACLARCNGADARAIRADQANIDQLRQQVQTTAAAPRGPMLVASYSRALLGQTGEGHFSPVAGYHPERDLVLILDVARFKYPPHWVPLPQLWQAMAGIDPVTGRPRGFILLDRGEQRAVPLYFRMSAGDGLGTLAATLLRDAPALLAESPGTTPDEIVAGWVERIEGRLADRLCQGIGTRMAATDQLPPEHRLAVLALLGELRATAVHRAVSRARSGDRPAQVPDDVLAILLLALPEPALTGLPAGARAALARLRDPAELGPALAPEINALRDQLTTLSQWQSTA